LKFPFTIRAQCRYSWTQRAAVLQESLHAGTAAERETIHGRVGGQGDRVGASLSDLDLVRRGGNLVRAPVERRAPGTAREVGPGQRGAVRDGARTVEDKEEANEFNTTVHRQRV